MQTYIATVPSPIGPWGVEGDDDVITRIYMPNETWRTSRGTVPQAVAAGVAQVDEYFAGTRRVFDLPLDVHGGTDFQREVWAALRTIAYGEVRTYAEVAAMVARPLAARAVGNANHANRLPLVVPCHRVVAAAGLGGYGGGLDVKQYLLTLEGAR